MGRDAKNEPIDRDGDEGLGDCGLGDGDWGLGDGGLGDCGLGASGAKGDTGRFFILSTKIKIVTPINIKKIKTTMPIITASRDFIIEYVRFIYIVFLSSLVIMAGRMNNICSSIATLYRTPYHGISAIINAKITIGNHSGPWTIGGRVAP